MVASTARLVARFEASTPVTAKIEVMKRMACAFDSDVTKPSARAFAGSVRA
jgi:hypothetical protein